MTSNLISTLQSLHACLTDFECQKHINGQKRPLTEPSDQRYPAQEDIPDYENLLWALVAYIYANRMHNNQPLRFSAQLPSTAARLGDTYPAIDVLARLQPDPYSQVWVRCADRHISPEYQYEIVYIPQDLPPTSAKRRATDTQVETVPCRDKEQVLDTLISMYAPIPSLTGKELHPHDPADQRYPAPTDIPHYMSTLSQLYQYLNTQPHPHFNLDAPHLAHPLLATYLRQAYPAIICRATHTSSNRFAFACIRCYPLHQDTSFRYEIVYIPFSHHTNFDNSRPYAIEEPVEITPCRNNEQVLETLLSMYE